MNRLINRFKIPSKVVVVDYNKPLQDQLSIRDIDEGLYKSGLIYKHCVNSDERSDVRKSIINWISSALVHKPSGNTDKC